MTFWTSTVPASACTHSHTASGLFTDAMICSTNGARSLFPDTALTALIVLTAMSATSAFVQFIWSLTAGMVNLNCPANPLRCFFDAASFVMAFRAAT